MFASSRHLPQLLALLIGLYPAMANALVVEVAEEAGPIPVLINHAGNSAPFSVELSLRNESGSVSVEVAVWQLNLSLDEDVSAAGELLFKEVSDPPNPFLDSPGDPAVVPPSMLPSDEITIQDADFPLPPDLPGKPLGPEEGRSIVVLDLAGSPNASGLARLILGEFNNAMPLTSSNWLPSGPPTPMAFANTPTPPHGLVLAEIIWENADFDLDGGVVGRDFLTWQQGFGSISTFAQGDANSNGSIDAEDLFAWETQYGFVSMLPAITAIPEPSCLTLWFSVIALLLATQPRLRQPMQTVSFKGRSRHF